MKEPKEPLLNPELDTKYFNSYAKQRQLLEAQLIRQRQRVTERQAKLDALPDDTIPRTIGVYKGNLAAVSRGARLTEGLIEFIRPSSLQDVAYRLRVYDELPRAIREAVPAGTPIRFHGTELPRARDILASGELSSSVDREGIETSYDVSGQVSVTMPEDIGTTVHDFSGILSRDCVMPAGCIFVLVPESEEDIKAGNSHLMGNVYFRTQPERIVGIMTSPENISQVQSWSEPAGIDPARVQEFFDFTDTLSRMYPPAEKTT